MHKLKKRISSIFIAFFVLPSILLAQTIYVAPTGNDFNSGAKDQPVATFVQAQLLAQKFPSTQTVEVIFSKGVYYLPQTILFTSADSKTGGATVTYRSENEGDAVVSGGTLLQLNWTPYKNGIFVADITGNPTIDQLYINGIRQRMARFPNAIANKNVYDTWDLSNGAYNASLDALTAIHISNWSDPTGGYIHGMDSRLWGDYHWIIKSKNADNTLVKEGGWQNNRPGNIHGTFRFVENIFEELDTPGEWFFNTKEQKIYFMPDASTNLSTAKIEIVRLKDLIEFNGTNASPVKSVNLKGFVFRHAARTFMENKEPLLRSDWTISRSGAVFYNGAEDCALIDCEFDQVGGNTVFVNNYNRRIKITGCNIHNSGASGVVFVGDPKSVRSPLFRYGNQNYATIDRTPGALTDNYPEDCLVENCLITLTGRDEKQTAGVQISMSHKIHVNHCSIYDLPRAGININEGTFSGHIIENCDVFNTVLETGDHGSFNSWGRDRYWTPDIVAVAKEMAKDPTLVSLDILDTTIIRNNRWRCDHGWDVDLDDASSYYQIYNNLFLNGGLKLREGYNRVVTNNILVNNNLNPHVWFPSSGDVFKHNIVVTAYKPANMNTGIPSNGKWGKELDYNYYVSSAAIMNAYAINDCDKNSKNGNPHFINATAGDFRVADGSPALQLGFVNFPMDQFGVTKPSLKAIAKTPQISAINTDIPLINGIVVNPIADGLYYVTISNGTTEYYLTDAYPHLVPVLNTQGKPIRFMPKITLGDTLSYQYFKLTLDGARYRFEGKYRLDNPQKYTTVYANENCDFGSVTYSRDWNSMLILYDGIHYAFQRGGNAGTNYWYPDKYDTGAKIISTATSIADGLVFNIKPVVITNAESTTKESHHVFASEGMIKIIGSTIANVTVYDFTGKIIENLHNVTSKIIGVSKGQYIVKVVSMDSTQIIKVIVN